MNRPIVAARWNDGNLGKFAQGDGAAAFHRVQRGAWPQTLPLIEAAKKTSADSVANGRNRHNHLISA